MTDLVKLFEQRVIRNVRLTDHQKRVLAMIIASPEGIVNDEDVSKGPNMTAARQALTKLGLITDEGENRFAVSDTGMQVAKDERLVDETGQLTDDGNKYAYPDQQQDTTVGAGPSGPSDEPASGAFAQTSTDIGLPGPSE